MNENEIKLALHDLDAARSKKEKYEGWSMKCKLWFALLAVAIMGVKGMEHSPTFVSWSDLIIVLFYSAAVFDFSFLYMMDQAGSRIRTISEKLVKAGLTLPLDKDNSVDSYPTAWIVIVTIAYYILWYAFKMVPNFG